MLDRNLEQRGMLSEGRTGLEHRTNIFDNASVPGITFLRRHDFSPDRFRDSTRATQTQNGKAGP